MIIWRGWGFLALLIPAALCGIFGKHEAYGLLLGGVIVLALGLWLKGRSSSRHELWYIPMHWCGVILILIGLGLLIAASAKKASHDAEMISPPASSPSVANTPSSATALPVAAPNTENAAYSPVSNPDPVSQAGAALPVPQVQDPIERAKSECDSGVAKSCVYLALNSLPVNHMMALAYYIKACDAKDGDSCGSAGSMYQLDMAVPHNTSLALQYMQRGCAMGSQFSCGQSEMLSQTIMYQNMSNVF